MKAKTIPIQTDNPRPWLWPLLLLAGVTLPILWLLPVLWSRSVTLGVLVAFVALPGLALVGILASWLYRWPQLLVYEVSGRGLTIQTHREPVQVARSEVRQAKPLEYALRWNPSSRGHLPGYYVGAYTLPEVGPLTAYVAQSRGQGVLLELKSGEKILLSPQNPDEVLKLFR
ncbi:MAG: PH domain-containing protein [Meiothermus sp.]|uniref:PH domain-containing protein n=1 Tax=Meiothermus sp. TaxID=1955249 RepID=UPI00298F120F|nr:PH domain-containing protein [Meiothermus sp.]MDW8426709.1 PH domain-containing protein [Meiothermus sp.]